MMVEIKIENNERIYFCVSSTAELLMKIIDNLYFIAGHRYSIKVLVDT